MRRLHFTFMFACIFQVTPIGIPIIAQARSVDDLAKRFIDRYEATVRPLEIDVNRWFWTANVTGKEEDFQKKQAVEEQLDLLLSDPVQFAELKRIKKARVTDPMLARQIDILYLEYLEKQVPQELLKKISAKSNAIQRAFNVFRANVDGQQLTDNDVHRILIESRNSAKRREVWEASKVVGRSVIADLRELVAVRNQAARKLGFRDFFAMRLYLGEQNEQQLLKLFDQLDEMTRKPFRQAKAEIDAGLASNYGIAVSDLRPWHYHDPFFQDSPAVLGAVPPAVYKPLDVVRMSRSFYDGIGLPADDILRRSDLYEKPGKNPSAFSQDMDREGDVRILENVVPSQEWLSTTLHELGHSVYSKNVRHDLPYVLRTDAHPLCTEGIAMMFERFGQNVDWLLAMGVKVPDADRYRAASAKMQRNRMLIFARWEQVMVRFERELYRDPDQDLNRLWWDLVEKYQELPRPKGRDEPDFAAKYHIVGAPVYYHNYMLGEMFASQVHHALVKAILPGTKPGSIAGAIYVGSPAAGKFLCERVFAPGLTMPWNELTRYATGEKLAPKAFAEDLMIAD